tara:strand:- start:521 stop:685 length:165 start_codon:yes stop_codon:yes gene_type:complete
MEMFKYLYHGDSIDLLTSGHVITEFILQSQYIMIVQDSNGDVIEISHTDLKDYE